MFDGKKIAKVNKEGRELRSEVNNIDETKGKRTNNQAKRWF